MSKRQRGHQIPLTGRPPELRRVGRSKKGVQLSGFPGEVVGLKRVLDGMNLADRLSKFLWAENLNLRPSR